VLDYISRHTLQEKVSVLSDVPHSDMRDVFLRHDVFALPSYDEPAAYSPLEAMAYGLPTIVSDTCGTKCYIKEGENGYIFKSKDEASLQHVLELCLTNRQQCIDMGKSARESVVRVHAPEVFARHMDMIIHERNI
jgi:glycosyltransferase involved in cell wall biosynthesis